MKATAEIQIVPLGEGVSVRRQVAAAVTLLRARELLVEPHASGTNLEGELEEILAALAALHEALHAQGTVRLISYLKLETRSDKPPSLAGKRLAPGD